MAPKQEGSANEDGFVAAKSNTEWYQNLKCFGSCLRLYDLLHGQRELIHQLGPEGITVLHKGVGHGCVKLVKFILTEMFDGEGKCTCRDGQEHVHLTMEELLRKKNVHGSTAVNMAVVSGSPKMVLLLKWAIDVISTRTNEESTEDSPPEVVWSFVPDCKANLHEDFEKLSSNFERERGVGVEGEAASDISKSSGNSIEAPGVKDDTIDKIYETGLRHREVDLIPSVYSVIEQVLENADGDFLQKEIDFLKAMCQKDPDFEFVPVAHVLPHFICSISGFGSFSTIKMLKKIFSACTAWDEKELGGSGSMMKALFKMLDPRGRTFLHVAFKNASYFIINEVAYWTLGDFSEREGTLNVNSPTVTMAECLNSRDGAGRSILHLWCIHDCYWSPEFFEKMDLNATLIPLCTGELDALKNWCFPCDKFLKDLVAGQNYIAPVHLAVIFNSSDSFKTLIYWKKDQIEVEYVRGLFKLPIQIAAFLGRATILEHILEHHKKFNSIHDLGFGNVESWYSDIPAIHCAALLGQVETIQKFLKYRTYDPNIQYWGGTALHVILNKLPFEDALKHLHTIALLHVLPNSESYERVKYQFHNLLQFVDFVGEQRMFSAGEISSINVLLQAGIDIQTFNCLDEPPTPGLEFNDEARKWWYDKVVTEVAMLKTSISSAANATSVVAALVATGSFIGPFQPPLGYANSDGYIQANLTSVRVYLVCNSLSFFFSIASILMAVLPAIPMPKESLYDELLRSQRCLKGAALMLLISIVCVLMSFSSASMAVVSSDWHERQLVVGCITFGGGICIVVLVIYIIRLLRMLFHKNDRFRRRFAKYMWF